MIKREAEFYVGEKILFRLFDAYGRPVEMKEGEVSFRNYNDVHQTWVYGITYYTRPTEVAMREFNEKELYIYIAPKGDDYGT